MYEDRLPRDKTHLHFSLVIVYGAPTTMTRGQGLNSRFSTMVRHGGDLGPWSRRFLPSGFFLDFFFFRGIGPCGSVPPPPLEWISSPPLVAAVFITTKGAESPGSSRMGVIGALVIFFSI